MSGKRRGALLDRDGTLVDVVRDAELGVVMTAFHPDQLRLLPGVVEGLKVLQEAGLTLAIATNQPGAAKGQIPLSAIQRTNDALVEMLAASGVAIAEIAVCLHHPDGGPGGDATLVGPCACRKPLPGLLESLARNLDLDAGASWMIGDSVADLSAARAAGMHAGLVFDPKRCELCPLREGPSGAPDLAAARFDLLARAIAAKS